MTTAHETSSPTTAVLRSQNVVLIYLPIVVIGIVALSLFAGFLGEQATEVAKLIEEIEASCQSVIQHQLQPATTSEALAESQSTTCQTYFGKVVLFFVLLILWCWATFVITLRAADSIKHIALRLAIAALVSISLPAIVFTKYFSAVQLSIYTDSGRFVDAFLHFDGRYPTLAALVAVVVILMQIVLIARFASRPSTAVHPLFIEISFWLSITAFVILSMLFTFAPGNPYDHVGSINLIVLYALLAYTFLAGLFHYSRKTGLPLATGLATYILIVNGLGLNHQFKTPQPEVPAGAQNRDLFHNWLKSRLDVDDYKDSKYPVYIVAASGGGMYAAMRTAYFLELIQKECPAFMHHTFAISSVSGGALGSLVFAAQHGLRDRPKSRSDVKCINPAAIAGQPESRNIETERVGRFFFQKRDLLSAIIGGGLFPQMLQAVIPWHFEALDRSRAFSKALRDNWLAAVEQIRTPPPDDRTCRIDNLFDERCTTHNYWSADQDVPVLMFNTTWVDTGTPVILSRLGPQYYASSLAARTVVNSNAVSLVRGVSLSSRFPVALPAGFVGDFSILPFASFKEGRLVDGGYFDNSGLIAARAVKNEIDRISAKAGLNVDVHLVFLGEKYDGIIDLLVSNGVKFVKDNETGMLAAKETKSFFDHWIRPGSELTAHATALLRARDQRSLETLKLISDIEKKERIINNSSASGDDPILEAEDRGDIIRFEWSPVTVDEQEMRDLEFKCTQSIPVAWYLAPCTHELVETKMARAMSSEGFRSIARLRQQLTPK